MKGTFSCIQIEWKLIALKLENGEADDGDDTDDTSGIMKKQKAIEPILVNFRVYIC